MYLSEWTSGDTISYTELIMGLASNSSSLYYPHVSLNKVKLLSVVFIVKTNNFFSRFKIILYYRCDFESKSAFILQALIYNFHGNLFFSFEN